MKKILFFILSVFMLFMYCMAPVNLVEVCAIEDTSYNEDYYDEYGNYENPETGEYFRWDSSKTRNADGTFKFRIRYSVQSAANYTPSSTKLIAQVRDVYLVGHGDYLEL